MKAWVMCLATVGCLERVTGDVVPLDSRFTAQAETSGTGTDTGGPAHQAQEHVAVEHKEVPPPQPFEDVEGDKVSIAGVIVAEVSGSVDLDVSRKDKNAPGGVKSEGKLLFAEAGPFEIQVPVSVGALRLVAFQDPDKDGPSATDYYAELDIDVGVESMDGIEITLVKGARGSGAGGPSHTEAPPGFGSGQAPPPDGQPQDVDPFADIEGARVTVSGIIRYSGAEVIDLDVFQPSDAAPGGRKLLGKLKRSAGEFSLEVPIGLGSLELDAFADKTGDGPSADDPRGQLRAIDLTQGAVENLDLSLETLVEKEPEKQPDGGGTDLEEEFKRTAAGGADRAGAEEAL